MKFSPIALVLLYFLNLSCGNSSPNESLREQIDSAKEELKDKDFSLSTYNDDSSKYWKVLSQISRIRKDGVRSLSIKSEFKQRDKIIKEIVNEINQVTDFFGQTITTDLPDKVSLCYLLKGDQNASVIFRINCNSEGEHQIEKLDSLNTKNWMVIKSAILNKK